MHVRTRVLGEDVIGIDLRKNDSVIPSILC
jgi:hypothetical protein